MIAAADAQRNIAINLTMIASPGNQSVAQKEVGHILAAQQAITKAAMQGAYSRLDSIVEELKKSNQAFQKYVSTIVAAERKRVKENKKANKEIVASVDKMSEKLEIAITRIGEKNEKIQKRIIKQSKKNNKALIAAIVDMAKKTESVLEKMEKKLTEITEKESQKRKKKREKETDHVKKLEKLNRTKIESYRTATEAGLGALQGTMDLVEGMASLGLMSEESFKKFEHGFQKVEAGFKALKGFTELVWKGREALVALSTATKAQAATNTILSNSNYRAAASQSAVKLAAGATGVVSGTGAVGAGAAGITGTGVTLGGAATAGAAIAGAAAAGLAAFELFQALRRGIFGASDSTESFVGALFSYRDALNEVEESSKRLEMSYTRTSEQEKRLAERSPIETQQYASRQVQRGSFALRRQVEFEISGNNRDPVKNVTEQRNQAAIANRDAEAEHQRVVQRNRELFKLGRAQEQDHEAAVRTARQLEESGNRLLETSRHRLQVLRDQSRAADDQLKSLEGQKDSLRVQYDRLSPGRKDRFDEISSRYAQGGVGDVNQRDIRFLEDIGLGGEIVTEFRSNRAQSSGSDAALRNSGEFRDIDKQVTEEEAKKKRASPAIIRAAEADAREKAKRQQGFRAERVRTDEGAAAALRARIQEKRIKEEIENSKQEKTFFSELFNKPTQNVFDTSDPLGSPEAALSPLLFFGRALSDQVSKSVSGGGDQSQQAAGQAADQVTQSGIGVEQAIKILLDAVTKSNENLITQIEESKILEKSYS